MNFTQLIQKASAEKISDLHFQTGQRPIIRMHDGNLAAFGEYPKITQKDIEDIIEKIANDEQKKRFAEELEFDFSYETKNTGRFRVNVFKERLGPAIALRLIADKIPAMEELGFGPDIEKILQLPHGLVLVTGPTGMGKSTSLAAMIDYINEHRQAHIITIEDPIEYIYENKNCLVTQREVNVHTHSFAKAIRSALRQDPNVVMVGEMRDLETIAATMTLAETGHLVFSTLHTIDAAQTVDRIIDVFPPYQQQQIKTQLANVLKCVISQILVPKIDGSGRIAAREIMFANDAIKNCIMQGQIHQIYSMIQINSADGMVLMDTSLENLVRDGKISKEDALSKANDPEVLIGCLDNLN